MTRDEFLQNIWVRYPTLDGPANDCSILKEGGVVTIGGRLNFERGQLLLSSGGASLEIKLAEGVVWSRFSVKETARFQSGILNSGDILLVKGTLQENRTLLCSELALLVPTQGEQYSISFDVNQAQKWSDFIDVVRTYFREYGFIEARTPTLVPSPGTEPFLDAFSTEAMFEGETKRLFLPTSPEFHLKKLLVAGFTKVFELKECFRNKESGTHHQPEFLMLEWYRAYSNLDAISDDCQRLLSTLTETFSGRAYSLKRTTIAQVFRDVLNFELTPKTTKQELLELAQSQKILVEADESWDDIYFRIFLEKIEPNLIQENPILLSNYPPSQAALARINEEGWADRFEIYWRGFEIANAFHELNDPLANLQRFEKDAVDARKLGKIPVPHDEELISALKTGMPPSGGIALGMDRLFMALTGAKSIAETRAFPFR